MIVLAFLFIAGIAVLQLMTVPSMIRDCDPIYLSTNLAAVVILLNMLEIGAFTLLWRSSDLSYANILFSVALVVDIQAILRSMLKAGSSYTPSAQYATFVAVISSVSIVIAYLLAFG